MPRNSSGTYALPAGNPVVTNTLIQSTWANTTLSDVSTAMTDSLDRNGRGAMLAALKNVDGSAVAPSLSFSSEGTLGIYRAAAGVLGFAVGGALVLSLASTGLTFTTPLVLPVGTVGAPALTFVSNTNTGIYQPATNAVGISAAGVQIGLFDTARLTVTGGARVAKNSVAYIDIVPQGITSDYQGALKLLDTGFDTSTNSASRGFTWTQVATLRMTLDTSGNLVLTNTLRTPNAVAHTWNDGGGIARRMLNLGSGGAFAVGDMDNAIASGTLNLFANGTIQSQINGSVIASVSSLGVSITGSGARLSIQTTAQNQILLANDAAYIAWFNTANTTRSGFLQMTAGGAVTLSQDQAQSLLFATSAVTRMTIDANGLVGMGTGPLSNVKLTLSDGTITTLLGFNYLSNTASGIGTNTNHALGFLTNGSERVRIDTTGNVGINQTPGNAYSGGKVLQIGTGCTVFGSTTTAILGENLNLDSSGNPVYALTAVSSMYKQASGNHQWNVAASGTAGTSITYTVAMTLDVNGNVGLGKAPGLYRIDLTTAAGQMVALDSTNANSGFVAFTTNGTAYGYIGNAKQVVTSGVIADMAVRAEAGLQFTSGGANAARLTITSAGVVQDAVAELGWKDLPVNSQAGPYTLVIGDRAKIVYCGATGVTIPASVFSQGQVVTIYNNSASSQTITQGASVTLYFGATGGSGNRTLGPRGIATVVCLAANTFVITGAGLS